MKNQTVALATGERRNRRLAVIQSTTVPLSNLAYIDEFVDGCIEDALTTNSDKAVHALCKLIDRLPLDDDQFAAVVVTRLAVVRRALIAANIANPTRFRILVENETRYTVLRTAVEWASNYDDPTVVDAHNVVLTDVFTRNPGVAMQVSGDLSWFDTPTIMNVVNIAARSEISELAKRLGYDDTVANDPFLAAVTLPAEVVAAPDSLRRTTPELAKAGWVGESNRLIETQFLEGVSAQFERSTDRNNTLWAKYLLDSGTWRDSYTAPVTDFAETAMRLFAADVSNGADWKLSALSAEAIIAVVLNPPTGDPWENLRFAVEASAETLGTNDDKDLEFLGLLVQLHGSFDQSEAVRHILNPTANHNITIAVQGLVAELDDMYLVAPEPCFDIAEFDSVNLEELFTNDVEAFDRLVERCRAAYIDDWPLPDIVVRYGIRHGIFSPIK